MACSASCSLVPYSVEGKTLKDMTRLVKLGSGAFARVYLYKDDGGTSIAVKVPRNIGDAKAQRIAAGELKILLLLQPHENVITFYGKFEDPNPFIFGFEYVCGKDLFDKIAELTEYRIRQITGDIAKALDHIHALGIVHRDLKLENVLLTKDYRAKITDFGLAAVVPYQGSAAATRLKQIPGRVGTLSYAPPECLTSPSDESAWCQVGDSWSLGVIFYFMQTKHSPFDRLGFKSLDLIRSVVSKKFSHPEDLGRMSPEVQAVVHALLEQDPKQRVSSYEDLVKLPYFKDVTP